jgi:hypothetical protein
VNPGFNAHNVLNFGLTFPPAFSAEPPPALRQHFQQITANLESIPGVEAASMVDAPLPMQGEDSVSFWLEGEPNALGLRLGSSIELPEGVADSAEAGAIHNVETGWEHSSSARFSATTTPMK